VKGAEIVNDAMNALLAHLEERQRDLLAQLEAIRAIRTLLLTQREKPSLLTSANALKEVNRLLEELPHSALTPQMRDIASNAKQIILEQAVQHIQLQIELRDAPNEGRGRRTDASEPSDPSSSQPS
jgi:hypothetical protein